MISGRWGHIGSFINVVIFLAILNAIRAYAGGTVTYAVEQFIYIVASGVPFVLILAIWNKIKRNIIAKGNYKRNMIEFVSEAFFTVIVAAWGFVYFYLEDVFKSDDITASTYWLIAIPAIIVISLVWFIYYKKKEA